MFEVGQSAEVSRNYSAEDVDEYVILGGARPHRDELPEPLIVALFSYLLGVKLPGIGTNYLKQRTRFLLRGSVNEKLTARVEITGLRPEKALVDLRTSCYNQAGQLLCEGRALVGVADVRLTGSGSASAQ